MKLPLADIDVFGPKVTEVEVPVNEFKALLLARKVIIAHMKRDGLNDAFQTALKDANLCIEKLQAFF